METPIDPSLARRKLDCIRRERIICNVAECVLVLAVVVLFIVKG